MTLLARLRASRRRLRFTREGRWYFGITLGIGLAAINTQNNLLYLLLSLLVSLIILSGVLSEAVLRKLDITRTPPLSIVAGRRTPIEIRVRNPKGYPSYAVEVEDLIDGHVTMRRCFYLKVSAGREQATTYPFVFPRRGRFRFRGYELRTKFPFGLFVKSRVIDAPAEVLAYPEPIADGARPEAEHGADDAARVERRGTGAELLDPRRFVDGDDPRLIRWRLSAKIGALLVADRAADESRRVEIRIDNRIAATAVTPEDSAREEARIEREISRAAWLVLEAARSRAATIRIVTADGGIGPSPASRSRSLLAFLALLPVLREPPEQALAARGAALSSSKGGRLPTGSTPAPPPHRSTAPPLHRTPPPPEAAR
ncbi:MAG: DUF58 domain-containing protein [Deltaproteobacteria bacterium]|nr:DUF58 domain-containing protein [Deltaproteobacteria bacterium]